MHWCTGVQCVFSHQHRHGMPLSLLKSNISPLPNTSHGRTHICDLRNPYHALKSISDMRVFEAKTGVLTLNSGRAKTNDETQKLVWKRTDAMHNNIMLQTPLQNQPLSWFQDVFASWDVYLAQAACHPIMRGQFETQWIPEINADKQNNPRLI